MKQIFCAVIVFGFEIFCEAQTNVRAWYTNGQVWVVWNYDTNNPPETFAIYAGTNNFTNVTQATLVGRLFGSEWSGANLKSQMDQAFGFRPTGYRVPTPGGTFYTLAENEGLFVWTVRASGTNNFAVVPWGQNIVSNVNRSPAVRYTFDLNDPPRPQIQGRGPSVAAIPAATNTVSIYMLFVDGDAEVNNGRPDFPIFANHHKRGSPHLFLMVEPSGGLPGGGPWPATMCFHGANGDAIEWLPSNTTAQSINVVPRDGYVIGFDDEIFSLVNGVPFGFNTRWIGYVPSFDPFVDVVSSPTEDNSLTNSYAAYNPPADQTIINYTQRRILWVLDWLIATANVDSNRVSLLGHSAGSMGAQSIARAYPERFSVVQLFNCGMRYYISGVLASRHGDALLNLPVTLTNHLGQQVHLLDLLFFTNRIAAPRDLPFFRAWHGKCDDNGAMRWGSDMLDEIRFMDRDAWGLHFYWDLRKHGMNEWKNFWVNATNLPAQTQRDDVRNQARYRNNQSYPAFFNLQNYANHLEPGPGYIGSTNPAASCTTTNANGDDHGTWGGYHDWLTTNIVDTATNWQCILFLVGTNSGYAPVDVSGNAILVSDIAIRRPQQFLPPPGTVLNWEVRDVASNNLFQSGTNVVGATGLVSATNVTVPRDPLRARLTIFAPPCAPAPTLYARLLTNAALELRWVACTNYDYQLENSLTLTNWRNAGPPFPAPPGGGWLTNVVTTANPYTFFRLRTHLLTNSPVPAAPGNHANLLFAADGILRSYRLMIPTSYNPAVSNACALILHGHGQTANSFAALHPDLFQTAQASNVILVLPDSTTDERSTGWNNYDPAPGEYQVNDVRFLLALIDHIDATLTLDQQRLYAGGFSSGGVMTHYLGARTTNVFAAFGMIEASIGTARGGPVVITNPPAAGPMPVLLLNCTNSCTRPYYGGTNSSGTLVSAAIDAVHYWTNANLCAMAMTSMTNSFVTNGMSRFENCDNKPPPGVPQPNQMITQRWFSCAPGTEVVFVTLTDGGHTWPDANDNLGFDTNRELLRFFLRHSRP